MVTLAVAGQGEPCTLQQSVGSMVAGRRESRPRERRLEGRRGTLRSIPIIGERRALLPSASPESLQGGSATRGAEAPLSSSLRSEFFPSPIRFLPCAFSLFFPAPSPAVAGARARARAAPGRVPSPKRRSDLRLRPQDPRLAGRPRLPSVLPEKLRPPAGAQRGRERGRERASEGRRGRGRD